MLLAPKILWAAAKLSGTFGGKWGARMHVTVHFRRRILQAAQGMKAPSIEEDMERGEDE